MTRVLYFWDGETSLTYPSGRTASASEVETKWPCSDGDYLLIGYLESGKVGCIERLETLKGIYGVDDTGTKEEQLAAVLAAWNAQIAEAEASESEEN